MKVLRKADNTVLRDAIGRVLRVRPDEYIEPSPTDFTFEVRVLNGTVFTLPTKSGFTYNATVNWGDGSATQTITAYNSANIAHTFVNEGAYLIQIAGRFENFTVDNNAAIKGMVTRVISWGDVHFKKVNFYGCTALTTLPNQQGRLTEVTTFTFFMYGCTSLSAIPYGIFFGNTLATDFSYCFT